MLATFAVTLCAFIASLGAKTVPAGIGGQTIEVRVLQRTDVPGSVSG